MPKAPIPLIFIAWVGTGAIRVLLGSSTSPIAYAFSGVFWIISLILLVAAVLQLLTTKKSEEKIESICTCVLVVSLFLQGFLGHGKATPLAAFAFLASAIVILFIYGRRLRRKHFIHRKISRSS